MIAMAIAPTERERAGCMLPPPPAIRNTPRGHDVIRLVLRHGLAATLALVLAGCAASGPAGSGTPAPRSMPAARQALPPAFRSVYDELSPHGEWTLIEPYGFCFKPRVNAVAWRPYDDGYWEASDLYGWVWISNEPFGWITYHYGSWFHDDFQGWVWQPGYQWGPAWVAWVESDGLFGWAPLPPAGHDGFAGVPGGLFNYTSAQQLASGSAMPLPESVGAIAARVGPGGLRPVLNLSNREGVVFNRGPSAEALRDAGAYPSRGVESAVPKPIATDLVPERADGEERLVMRSRRVVDQGVREFEAARAGRVAPRPAPGRSRPARPVPARAPSDSTAAAPDSLR